MVNSSLIIQTFGNEKEYRRAVVTVLSFFACLPVSHEAGAIIFTDNPAFFASYFADLPVRFIQLSGQKIREMRGGIDFLHRIKIAVIEEAFKQASGKLLYADSDTFFISDPTSFLKRVGPRQAFMHLLEYDFASLRQLPLPMATTFHAFLNLIKSKDFTLSGGRTISIKADQVSWNAGVMMLDPSHKGFLPDVYALTDQFYPATGNHACEQYAFSVILQHNVSIGACDQSVCHYWPQVQKRIADLYLANHIDKLFANLPLDRKFTQVKVMTRALCHLFEHHYLVHQDKAIQAFNNNLYGAGYLFSFNAFVKRPLDIYFFRDVMYHTKRLFFGNK